MENVPPRVVIDPEDAVVRIMAPGCCVVLDGVEQMRSVRDSLSGHIALLEAETVQMGRVPSPHPEDAARIDHERREYTEPDRVKWFAGGDAR